MLMERNLLALCADGVRREMPTNFSALAFFFFFLFWRLRIFVQERHRIHRLYRRDKNQRQQSHLRHVEDQTCLVNRRRGEKR